MFTAWQAERMAREERLRGLKYYLDEMKPKKAETPDEMLELFRGFADRGLLSMTEKPN